MTGRRRPPLRSVPPAATTDGPAGSPAPDGLVPDGLVPDDPIAATRRPPPVAGRVAMVPSATIVDDRTLVYAVSDNEPDVPSDRQIWAVNLHGFFAGGGMYWRESARLAGGLGWRVVNPSLPAFGGSTPMPWGELRMHGYAGVVARLLDHLGVERAVLLGHSMGGAVAMQFAFDHPDRTLGVVYRDGAGPGSWKRRTGLISKLTGPVAPDIGMLVEIMLAAAADVPDLAWGRVGAMVRGVWADARRNLYDLAETVPVAAMLFAEDLDPVIEAVGRSSVPVLPLHGRFDRLVPGDTAQEFGRLVDEPVIWVNGGHSWMLPRPVTQLRVLRQHEQGRAFLEQVAARARQRRRRLAT